MPFQDTILETQSISKLLELKTSLYYNSFLPSILRQWNNLSIETRQLNFLKEDKRTVPKYYFYGVRKAQILHTRLCLGCISLNLDLFMKNITDSPMCQCGSTENTQHFFFHCNFYQRLRTILSCVLGRAVTNVGRICGPTLLLVHVYIKAIKYV